MSEDTLVVQRAGFDVDVDMCCVDSSLLYLFFGELRVKISNTILIF